MTASDIFQVRPPLPHAFTQGALQQAMVYIANISHLEPIMDTAKVFWSGRSQAVRLPMEFRFQGSEVRIRRHGSTVILEPIATDWSWLDALAGKLDDDFVVAVEEQVPAQERPSVEAFFK